MNSSVSMQSLNWTVNMDCKYKRHGLIVINLDILDLLDILMEVNSGLFCREWLQKMQTTKLLLELSDLGLHCLLEPKCPKALERMIKHQFLAVQSQYFYSLFCTSVFQDSVNAAEKAAKNHRWNNDIKVS